MNMGGLFSVIGIIVVAVLLLPLIVGGIFVIVVVANRAEPDASGRRPAVVYAYGTAYLTLFTALFATTTLVGSLSRLIGSHGSAGIDAKIAAGFGDRAVSLHPIGDAVARGSVAAGLVALAAGIACALHLSAAARGSAGAPATDPIARVRASYISATSFLCVLIAIGGSVVAVYSIFRVAAPGVFAPHASHDRVGLLRTLIPATYITVAALVILVAHVRQAPSPFQSLFTRRVLPSTPNSAARDDAGPQLPDQQ